MDWNIDRHIEAATHRWDEAATRFEQAVDIYKDSLKPETRGEVKR